MAFALPLGYSYINKNCFEQGYYKTMRKRKSIAYSKAIMKMIKKDTSIIPGNIDTKQEILSSLNEDGTTFVDETSERSKLSSFISLQLLEQWYPDSKTINLQAPCGCGKSYFATNTVLQNQDKALNLVIFRTELYGFIKSMYEKAGIETHEITSEESLTEEELSVINNKLTIASYQNLYLKAWAHELYKQEEVEPLSTEELKAKVIASVKDKVVFIDEADFIITQIIAETKPVYDILNKVVIETFDAIYKKKIAALISLYKLITEHSSKLIFMSATTNSRYEEIMTAIGAVNIDTSFLEQKYLERNGRAIKIDSYNLVSITEIPYIQKRLNENVMLSDEIMCKMIMRHHKRKTLIYGVRAGIINIASVIATGIELGLRTAIIVDEDRLNQGWSTYRGENDIVMKYDSQLSRNRNFKHNVIKHIEEKLLRPLHDNELDLMLIKNAEEEVAKVFCNRIFETHDIVYISTNGARAISITNLVDEDVQVITNESNTNTEVVQSWARFRKANVHAIVLQRQNRGVETKVNFDDNAHMQNQIALAMTDDPDIELQQTTLTGINRKNARYPTLMSISKEKMTEWIMAEPISDKRIACVERQVKSSNNLTYINPNLQYLETELKQKDMLICLKTKRKGLAVNENTKTKNRRRLILSLLEENPKISSKEIRDKFESLGESKPSEQLLSDMRKEFKEQQQ